MSLFMLMSCGTATEEVKPVVIDLPESTPEWLLENLKGRKLLEKKHVSILKKERADASAYFFIGERFSDELLLRITAKADTTYVQWMSYAKAYEAIGKGPGHMGAASNKDVRMRRPFEYMEVKIPTIVWENFLDFNAHQTTSTDTMFDSESNFIMLLGDGPEPRYLSFKYGLNRNDSEFELLELIAQNRYPVPMKSPGELEDFIYPMDSIPDDSSIHIIVNRTFYPVEEIVCYPISGGQWKCHYVAAEFRGDTLGEGKVHSQGKHAKTGKKYYLMQVADSSFTIDGVYGTELLQALEKSTISYPDFRIRMPVLDGVSYWIALSKQGDLHHKSYDNPPMFMQEVRTMMDFISVARPDF